MAKYKINEDVMGCVVWTAAPTFERKEKGRFELNKCSQKDLEYLFKLGIKGIEKEEDERPTKNKTKPKNNSEK